MKTIIWDFGYGFMSGGYWACPDTTPSGKTYALHPNSWTPWGRVVHAVAIRGKPWYHRNLYFSAITGEQVQYEALQPLKVKAQGMVGA